MSARRPNISKSVTRVFQVLELFRARREPMTAAAIQAALRIPQPSARALLKDLVRLGYLDYRAGDRAYFPSRQLAQLGDWISHAQLVTPEIASLVDAACTEADETASLCTVQGVNVEILHARVAGHPVALGLATGTGSLLWQSGVGLSLLSLYDEAELAPLLESMLGANLDQPASVRPDEILDQVRGIARDGHLVGYDILMRGIGVVCVPFIAGRHRVALAVAGMNERIREDHERHIRTLRRYARGITALVDRDAAAMRPLPREH